eukprot:scaffold1294_cov167-Amphora_coffeaeformis.AAC.7
MELLFPLCFAFRVFCDVLLPNHPSRYRTNGYFFWFQPELGHTRIPRTEAFYGPSKKDPKEFGS